MRLIVLVLGLLLLPATAAEPIGVFAPTDEDLRRATGMVDVGIHSIPPGPDLSPVREALRYVADGVDPEHQHVGPLVDSVDANMPGDLVALGWEELWRLLDMNHCSASPEWEGQTGVLVEPDGRHVYVFVAFDSVPTNSLSVAVFQETFAILSLQGGDGAGADAGACAPALQTAGYIVDRVREYGGVP